MSSGDEVALPSGRGSEFLKFSALFLGLAVAKLLLVADQHVSPLYWVHDDLLFVNWAVSILEGQWLGPFQAQTLVKLPGYSFWIAGARWLGIPLLLSQQLVSLAVAYLVGVLALRWRVSAGGAAAASALYIFSPHTFSFVQTRAVRDYLFGELTTLVLVVAALFLTTERRSGAYLWALFTAPLLAYYCTIREEYYWIAPSILAISLIDCYFSKTRAGLGRIHRTALWLIPCLAGVLTALSLLSHVNERYYGGSLHYVRESGSGFSRALNAFRLFSGMPERPYVPVSKEMLAQAAKVSPSFAIISDRVNEMINSQYTNEGALLFTEHGDVLAGSIPFVLLSAAAQFGKADSLPIHSEFFNSIADEIEAACQQGTASCHDKPNRYPSLTDVGFLRRFGRYLGLTMYQTLLVPTRVGEYYGDIQMVPVYSWIVGDEYTPEIQARVDEYIGFDGARYLADNEDVRRIGMDPLFHYLFYGIYEHRLSDAKAPIRAISSLEYLRRYPELRGAGVPFAQHQLMYQGEPSNGVKPPYLASVITPDHRLETLRARVRDGLRPIGAIVQLWSCFVVGVLLCRLITRRDPAVMKMASICAFVAVACVLRNFIISYVYAAFYFSDETVRYMMPSQALWALLASMMLAVGCSPDVGLVREIRAFHLRGRS